jgi:hypothetical protein
MNHRGNYHQLGGRGSGDYFTTMNGALDLLALILSFVTAFLGAPFVYNLTDQWVSDISMLAYGTSDFTLLAWKVLCYPLVFTIARVGWIYLVTLLGSSVLLRLAPSFA